MEPSLDGSSTTTGAGGTGGAGGEGTGGGDLGLGGLGGGSSACGHTYDRFAFALGIDGAPTLGCDTAEPGANESLHIQGLVLTASTTELTLDTCPPGTACDSDTIYHLTAHSPVFQLPSSTGYFIDIQATVSFTGACVSTLVGRNLPEWNGVLNPKGTGSQLLFVGVDGMATAPVGLPFSVSTKPIGCTPDKTGCGAQPDDHRFRIQTSQKVVNVDQGVIKFFTATEDGEELKLMFRNLRSFESGVCDDHWNWAYWVKPASIAD
ncbi:Hypothetical protein A7982_08211 [Minicystis rosea]|nr:Hypothetical protein A7982_08211 [Minicystis rosea]